MKEADRGLVFNFPIPRLSTFPVIKFRIYFYRTVPHLKEWNIWDILCWSKHVKKKKRENKWYIWAHEKKSLSSKANEVFNSMKGPNTLHQLHMSRLWISVAKKLITFLSLLVFVFYLSLLEYCSEVSFPLLLKSHFFLNLLLIYIYIHIYKFIFSFWRCYQLSTETYNGNKKSASDNGLLHRALTTANALFTHNCTIYQGKDTSHFAA